MEVEIISKECIKPSSPTPPNLRTHKLSLLDQIDAAAHFPLIVFYPMNQSTSHAAVDIFFQRSQLLKQSLSEVLTRFYVFAGTIKDNLSIDCNDKGVYYLEARVNCRLVDCLSQPNLPSFEKFIPRDYTWKETGAGDDHVAMIKVTSFTCGGMAIGILVTHMVADGTSLNIFLKGWAAMARKACDEAVYPNFDAPSTFPQNVACSREEASFMSFCRPFLKLGKFTTRRIVFDASAITSLKAKATSKSVQNPTRVEVVSALLWKCIMAASNKKSGIQSQRPTFISHSVNLRGRAAPPLPESSMGNLYWRAGALCTPEEMELASMVSKLREAIKNVSPGFVKGLQGDGGLHKLCEHVKAMAGACSSATNSCGMDYIGFTSWCNFGVYDIDFGWGKPVWVSCIGLNEELDLRFPSTIALMDTRSVGGIEAWLYLDKEVMAILAQNKEILALGSWDPSPIN